MKLFKILFVTSYMAGLLVSNANAQNITVPDRLLPFETVLKLKNSGIDRPLDIVIKTEDAWCKFWHKAYGNRIPILPCDTTLVDFSREVVVASALGAKPNQCYDVNIVSIIETFNLPYPPRKPSVSPYGRKWIVRVADTEPGRGAICLQAIATPVHAVKVKRRPPAKVDFVHFPVRLSWGN